MNHNDTDDTDDRRGVGRRSVLGALGLGVGASLVGGAGWLLDQVDGTRRLTALLSGANQVPPVESTGTGTATFTLNEDGTLDYRVVVVDLAGVTQAHVHEGGPDESGPIVAPLFQFTENVDGSGEGFPRDATAEDPVVRSGTIEDESLVEDILANPDGFYVNVHTVENPAGEIRGQVMAEAEATTFTVRIENVSTEETLSVDDETQAVPLSPGAYAVYPAPDLPEPSVTETPAGNATGNSSATGSETPGTETETPALLTETPVDETETPGVETPTPLVEEETPTPLVEEETPTETPTPLVEEETPTETPTPEPTPTVTPASPVVPNPIFTPGLPERGNGLEQIAEDGDPSALAQMLAMAPDVAQSGVFSRPVGIEEPGPIGPGDAYEFVITGTPEQRLTFATMFIPSNDLFYAPDADGIALFEGGEPISGDVTEQVLLWDAGTEENEQPGAGAGQAPRQDLPGQGVDTSQPIRPVDEVDDGFTYPPVSEVIQVTISPGIEAARETPPGEPTPTPTEEPAVETPTEEFEEETPTEEFEEETPTEEFEEETPTEEFEEETPTETPGDGDGY